jgi:hypothetical protein
MTLPSNPSVAAPAVPPNPPPCLVACLHIPLAVLPPLPPLVTAPLPVAPLVNLPKCPQTPTTVSDLTVNFKHHPALECPLPQKCYTRAWLQGALAEANAAGPAEDFSIPLVNAIEWAFLTSSNLEPRTLVDTLKWADADKWVAAALAEIEVHIQNGTWVLAQLPAGRRAIGLHWVFKVKCLPDGTIDKYKGQIVAQGFLQVQGVHVMESIVGKGPGWI